MTDRKRWDPTWGQILAWGLWLLVVLIGWLALLVIAHFSCGGTLGFFGESPNADRDETCYTIRVVLFTALAILAIPGPWLGLRLWRRRRRTRGNQLNSSERKE